MLLPQCLGPVRLSASMCVRQLSALHCWLSCTSSALVTGKPEPPPVQSWCVKCRCAWLSWCGCRGAGGQRGLRPRQVGKEHIHALCVAGVLCLSLPLHIGGCLAFPLLLFIALTGSAALVPLMETEHSVCHSGPSPCCVLKVSQLPAPYSTLLSH